MTSRTSHRARFLAPVVLLGWLCLAAAPCAAQANLPQRLIVAKGSWPLARTIDGTTRRVLPPSRLQIALPLATAGTDPILRFSIGFERGAEPATLTFEIWLHAKNGQMAPIYQRNVSEAGWWDESIDLKGRELAGARLVFRKRLSAGSRGTFARTFWAEPMLVPRRPAAAPSVVLVSIDTLRADMVGIYGSRGTTPALDHLAKSGAWYSQAYSPSTWTFPSHYALLRGVLARTLPSDPAPPTALPSRRSPSLAETLRDSGRLTAAFTGGGFLSPLYAFAEGFDTYFSFEGSQGYDVCSPDRFDGPDVFRRAQEWLRAQEGRPFFLFVHTYDAHDRCGFGRKGAFDTMNSVVEKKRPDLVAHYRQKVADADRLLGSLLDTLAALKRDEDTLVVVTSDHGEELWEHGVAGHGCPLKPYEELVRVPLLFRDPRQPPSGGPITTPVSTVAIARTILGSLGISPPPSMTEVAALPLRAAPAPGDPVYVQCRDLLAVRHGRYKLISSRKKAFADETYDLQEDPHEKKRLAADHTATRQLQKLAEQYWRGDGSDLPPESTEKLDETTRERLRALGYAE